MGPLWYESLVCTPVPWIRCCQCAENRTYTIYDGINRPIVVKDGLGHETHTRYNALGYRTVVTDADGGVTYYGYDGLNRLVTIEYPEFTVQYAYDAVGNCTTVTDSVGVTSYVYDDLYRLVNVDDPITGTVGYDYDRAGNRTQLTYPTGEVVTYAYDGDNRLTQVEDWDDGRTTYAYDGAGRLVTTTLPNGVAIVDEYDAAGWLVALTHTAADDTLLSNYQYKLDSMGNRVQITETLAEITHVIDYVYDPLERLVEANYSTGEYFEYTYDAVGNRTAMTTTVGATQYEYDNANRLTSAGNVVYTWDDRGNLVNDGTFSYTYNAAGQMVRAENVTVTLVYTYNANGLRVAQSVDGTVTTFAWDWASKTPEMLSENGNLYLVGYETLGQWDGSTWAYYLSDALGSIRQTTDNTGSVTDSREWTPFGVEIGTGQAKLGYTGEWQDALLGLTYLRARWYAPTTGRFTQQDPWKGNHLHPLTMNSYLYVLANPVKWVDPTGLYAEDPGCEQEGDCTIHEVVKYIVGRIREDAAGQDIKEIRELNETHFYDDAWVECQRMPWWQRWLFCSGDYLQSALDADMAARSLALIKFGCLVADSRLRPTCGQWDYKKEIGDSWGQAQKIDFCSIGRDEEVIFYYDIWANTHFGYLGMTGGYSEDALLTGAAIEHAGSNPGQFEDDSSDRAAVKIGMHLYKSTLSEKAFLWQLYLHQDELNKAIVEDGIIIEVYQ